MNITTFATPVSKSLDQPKKTIAPWLSTLADVHTKYFDNNSIAMSYEEIRDDVIKNHHHLPLRELAAVLGVVEKQYKEMAMKKAH